MKRIHLKGQDLVLAIQLARPVSDVSSKNAVHVNQGASWEIVSLAYSIFVSGSEVHAGLKRLRVAQLARTDRYQVLSSALLEFLEHGVRYAFPAQHGAEVPGVPTALSNPDVRDLLGIREDSSLVWPLPDDHRFRSDSKQDWNVDRLIRGHAVAPLYPTVPLAAMRDPWLHKMLSLVDCLCLGQARERQAAIEALRNELQHD